VDWHVLFRELPGNCVPLDAEKGPDFIYSKPSVLHCPAPMPGPPSRVLFLYRDQRVFDSFYPYLRSREPRLVLRSILPRRAKSATAFLGFLGRSPGFGVVWLVFSKEGLARRGPKGFVSRLPQSETTVRGLPQEILRGV